MTHRQKLVARIPVVRHLYARPRLASGAIFGGVLLCLLPHDWLLPTRLLAAWDGGVTFYLALTSFLMSRADEGDIRQRAAQQDDGRFAVLGMSVAAAIATLGAIVAELGHAKEMTGVTQTEHVGLAVVTVVLSWAFVHTMFAVHYAHEYFSDDGRGRDKSGLQFPGGQGGADITTYVPDYWDFMYFSFVIGAAAATADIDISSQSMRRIAGLHCVIAFFFNTSVLALTVNIGASLF